MATRLIEFYSMKFSATFAILILGYFFQPTMKILAKQDIIQRETVDTIFFAKGIIRQQPQSDIYLIECQEKFLKLNVLNLPKEYQEADLPIVFSGKIKLTYPMEDEAGDYFEITSIR